MNRIFRVLFGAGGLAGCIVVFASEATAQAVSPATAPAVLDQSRRPASAPRFFGTVAVPIPAQRFQAEWERARQNASHVADMRRLIAPAVNLSRREQIAYVQAAVSRKIGWRSDATQYGRHDYWASAEETLRRGRGDMEDRAILKMQALRALGVPGSDLYLTLGRDSVAGPQAVLIVLVGGTHLVLDDGGGPPFSPDRRPEFRPLLSFSYGTSWVHTGSGAGPMIATTASGARRAVNRHRE